MWRLALLLFALWPIASLAQTADEDRGYLEALLEDNLSGAGRQVDIVGFAGALSRTATIERLTVADAEGVWITLEDLRLQWNRGRLLSGRIEIGELSAARVILPRLPVAEEGAGLPSAEARPFSLPELPVSVEIDALRIDQVTLGEAIIGQEVVLSLTGQAALEGGEGTATLAADRLDRGGRFTVEGAFVNATRELDIALDLSEPAEGIAATLLDLPGRPSLDLTLTGAGPLGDFGADLRLATDGQERLGGRIETTTRSGPDGDNQTLSLDIGGDIAPVLLPAYRPFFGDDIRLVAEAQRLPDGALALDRLDLRARHLSLTGAARLAPDGWPVVLDIEGKIASDTDAPVILPLPGPVAKVDEVRLDIQHDARTGEDWDLSFGISGFDRDGVRAQSLSLAGEGRIARGNGLSASGFQGEVALAALSLAFADPALAQAIGQSLFGDFKLDWASGAPLGISDMRFSGSDYGLTGDVTVSGGTDGPVIALDAELASDDLSRFAALATLDALAGAADLAIRGQVLPLQRSFELSFDGDVDDLTTGIAQLDPLLEGTGQLDATVARDVAGTRISGLDVTTNHARIRGDANVTNSSVDADLSLDIADAGRALPGLDGPLSVVLDANGRAPDWRVDVTAAAAGGTDLRFAGTVRGDGVNRLTADGTLNGSIAQLAAYAQISGQPDLTGSLKLELAGSGDLLARAGSLTGTLQTRGARSGIAAVDDLIAPNAEVAIDVARASDTAITLNRLTIDASNLRGQLDGAYTADGAVSLNYDMGLNSVTPFVRGVRGPVAAQGQIVGVGGESYTLETRVSGPGGADLTLGGRLSANMDAELRVAGTIAQLSAFRAVASGQALSGGAAITAGVIANLSTLSGRVQGQLSGRGLRSGIETIDLLAGGAPTLDFDVTRSDTGRIDITDFELLGSNLSAGLSGALDGSSADVGFDARVNNVAPLVPGLEGAASANGTLTRAGGGPYRVNTSLQGPGGSTLQASGTVSADGQSLGLGIDGRAPLALANRQLRPRVLSGLADFNLRVDGPPRLSSVSGVISTSGARLSLPTLREALTDIAARVSLGGGQAQINLTSAVSSGGTLRVNGPVGLTAPFTADLTIGVGTLGLKRDRLLESTIDGTLSLRGPLAGGPRLGGQLTLGPTELRVPEGGGLGFGGLEGLEHRNLPADVALTMRRAGIDLSNSRSASDDDQGDGIPLDVTVRAPQRIFVRGRGLDAELGGELRVTGTTSAIVPQGQFTLLRGHLALLGRRLTLDEGTIQLRGALDPEIRFAASSTVEDVSLSLLLSGELSQPELTLTSSPELPEEEILSLFLFGRNATQISALQLVRLAAAVRTLSGRGGNLSENIRQGIGVDTLDLNTAEDGTTEATVGAYISDKVYTDVTVDSAGESQINLNLTVRPGVVVRGRANNRGETGIGIFIERDY